MNLICFDNHVLIWGIKEQCIEGQEDMIARAKDFIDNLNNETLVLIPSLVVAEFLMNVPPNLHAMVINLFSKKFVISSFDALCASKYTQIWQAHKSIADAEILAKSGKTRAELKADGMIVAIAVANKAQCIYSHDKWVKTFSEGFIDVKEIPPVKPKQKDAFDSVPNNTFQGKIGNFNEPN
jgi:hypothetical protein